MVPLAAEELLNIIRSRRSDRRIAGAPVSEEYVDLLIEAARWAPSSCNMQLLGLIRIEDKKLREDLVIKARSHESVRTAPVVFLVTYDKELSQEYNSNIQSGAAAIQNMMLLATSLGLSCFWAATVGKEKKVRSLLNIPNRRAILAFAIFGWPHKTLLAPRRRNACELIHLNSYYSNKDVVLSENPDDWALDSLKTFHELRLRSGARYIPYLQDEFETVVRTIFSHTPSHPKSWLDVLPGSGAYTEAMVKHFSEVDFSIADIADQMMLFTSERAGKSLSKIAYDFSGLGAKRYDVVSCLFRLEAYPSSVRNTILNDLTSVVNPGGLLILGVTNARSFFLPLYRFKKWLKKEFRFPTMTPNMIAPFMPIQPELARDIIVNEGFSLMHEESLFFLPTSEELSTFYSANPKNKKSFLSFVEKMLFFLPKDFISRRSKIKIYFFKKNVSGEM